MPLGLFKPRTITDRFYDILAGGAVAKLFESVVNLQLLDLFYQEAQSPSKKTRFSENELIEHLNLHPLRAKKWLFLLTRAGFLERDFSPHGTSYGLTPLSKRFLSHYETQWWFFKEMTCSWQTVAYEPFHPILQGSTVNFDVSWPPQNQLDSALLEQWMRKTASNPILSMLEAIDFESVHHLLDIGGGDGTMACLLAQKFPHLKVC